MLLYKQFKKDLIKYINKEKNEIFLLNIHKKEN